MSLWLLPESEAGHNDYAQWWFEAQRAEWEHDREQEEDMANNATQLIPVKMTACRDCKHYLYKRASAVMNRTTEEPIWYEMYCGASPIPPQFDPYSGETKRASYEEEFRHCREVNTGHCPKFEAKVDGSLH